MLFAGSAFGDVVGFGFGQGDRGVGAAPFGHEPAKFGAAVHEVFDFRGVHAGVVVRGPVKVGVELVIADRDAQVVTEGFEVFHGQFLHLVGRVAALEVRAQAVALDRFGQDHGGFALELGRCLVRGVDLAVVVTAAFEAPDLLIVQVRDHVLGLRGLTEEVLTDEPAGLGLVGLVVTIGGFVHDFHQRPVLVRFQQGVPFPAPDDLDHVPARTAEERFEFLHDLAVATHRPVQALEVAVDHEVQVVQVLVRCQLQQTTGLGLVHFPVTKERPDLLVRGVLDPTVLQVPVGLGLVNRVHRADTHRHGREFPEIRHQPRVRVRGQRMPGLGLLLTEPVQILLAQPAFHERPGVHPRRRVTLEKHLVPATGVVLTAEEMVEPHLIQRRSTGISGNMPTHTNIRALRTMDHHRSVPPHIRPIPALELLVPRERRFLIHRDRVHIISGRHHRHTHRPGTSTLQQRTHNVLSPLGTLLSDQRIKGLNPLRGLFRITIRQLGSQPAEDV
ncbi:pyruvate dehydrogenase E1 component domain protein [Paenarthrobacter nicotinovorans]|nr:pyruvate dehydrogenase E1 component domain protein [Paenarthrobacter nicotinovorans]GAT87106.1 pyruvate dehydrogenase E1 component domain protein [Paenarthrobacter nicotinovorans]